MYSPVTNWYYSTFKAPKRYHHLFDEITKIKATRILEVGTWNGNRAVQMIAVAQKNSSKPVTYVGFDLFESLTDALYHLEISKRPPSKAEVQNTLAASNADVTLIQGNTLTTLPEFAHSAEKFDFIFIDGGHDVATIQSDWDSVAKLMHQHTVVIFDDYWRSVPDKAAKPVVDKIDQSKYVVEILPEVDVFNNPDFGQLKISFAKVTLR